MEQINVEQINGEDLIQLKASATYVCCCYGIEKKYCVWAHWLKCSTTLLDVVLQLDPLQLEEHIKHVPTIHSSGECMYTWATF